MPRAGGHLELYWELLARLDTLTLQSFVETLEHSLAQLSDAAPGQRTEVQRLLRVIEGGK